MARFRDRPHATSADASRLRGRPDGWSFARVAMLGAAALFGAIVLIARPPGAPLAPQPLDAAAAGPPASITALRRPSGASGEVRLQLRMPGELFDFSLVREEPAELVMYQWLKTEDSTAVVPPRMLLGSTVAAPLRAGFYRLAVSHADGRRVIDSNIVAVLVPFAAKLGSTLNGYRIGRYQWERMSGEAMPPIRGFIEVRPADVGLPVSTHFQLAHFLTHDGQETWPRYLALDPRILDKVELVLRYLGARNREIPVDMHSGFRTPLYNRRVPRAASDSRHQYGDAADLAIDADGDGRITHLDGLAVTHAVEMVERDHPQLVGGLGVYGNRGAGTYVHIDVRGQRKRWRG